MAEATIAGFPADANVETGISSEGEGRYTRVEINSRITGPDYSAQIQRKFFPGSKKVYHSFFKINGKQGSGIAAGCLKSSIEEYKKAGYEKVEVHAALTVGAYAWAKFGFVPTPDSWSNLQRQMKRRLSAETHFKATPDQQKAEDALRGDAYYEAVEKRKIPDQMKADMRKMLNNAQNVDNPKALWKVSDHPLGKTLLMGLDWHGALDIKDTEQYNRCMAYCNKPAKPAKKED
jgi:hypothetical protein